MSVRIKIAQTACELEDVFRLRYQVYVEESGVFGSADKDAGLIVDQFDAYPPTASIIAYDRDQPVGTMRLNLDTGRGLPADEYFDFSAFRREVTRSWRRKTGHGPRVGSAGMLAVAKAWQNRRDVIGALLKMGAGIGEQWGGTHILATASARTARMYERCGFRALAEPVWIEAIGDHIAPLVAEFTAFRDWAFGDLLEKNHLLDLFSGAFERVLYGAGETIFEIGDEAQEGYVIDRGTVSISRDGPDKKELTLANLGRGALFGEMSLIDSKPRSANAVALSNVELIALSRDNFRQQLAENPTRMRYVLDLLAERLRQMDELAVVLAYGTADGRVRHALEAVRQDAAKDAKHPGCRVAKLGPAELARKAGVPENQVRAYLETLRLQQQRVEYSNSRIRFFEDAPEGADLEPLEEG